MKYISMLFNIMGITLIVTGAVLTALGVEGAIITWMLSWFNESFARFPFYCVLVSSACFVAFIVGVFFTWITGPHEEWSSWLDGYDSYDYQPINKVSLPATTTPAKPQTVKPAVAPQADPAVKPPHQPSFWMRDNKPNEHEAKSVMAAVPAPEPQKVAAPPAPTEAPQEDSTEKVEVLPAEDPEKNKDTAPVPVYKDDNPELEVPVIATMDEGPKEGEGEA